VSSKEVDDIFGEFDTFFFRLLAEDGCPCLKDWGLNVGYQAPFKPVDQPLPYSTNVLGRSIARNYDLLLDVVESIEGVEEFFLCTFLVRDELDVIHQQDINLPVTFSKTLGLPCSNGIYEFVCELLRWDILDMEMGGLLQNCMSRGMHEVCLA